jgi:hypothetical protein
VPFLHSFVVKKELIFFSKRFLVYDWSAVAEKSRLIWQRIVFLLLNGVFSSQFRQRDQRRTFQKITILLKRFVLVSRTKKEVFSQNSSFFLLLRSLTHTICTHTHTLTHTHAHTHTHIHAHLTRIFRESCPIASNLIAQNSSRVLRRIV